MRISNLRVQRYRSLYDLDIDLAPLSALIGPNGGGKSNFIDALNFIGLALSNGLESAVNLKGGLGRFAFRRRGKASRLVAFQISMRFTLTEIQSPRLEFREQLEQLLASGGPAPEFELTYGFRIAEGGTDGFNDFSVASESMDLRAIDGNQGLSLLTIARDRGDVRAVLTKSDKIEPGLWRELVWPFEDEGFANYLSGAVREDQLLAGALAFNAFNAVIASVMRQLSLIQTYVISPALSKLPGVPSPIGQLYWSGANLPSAVNTLQRNFPDRWERVLDRMLELEPRFEEIGAKLTQERTLALQSGELGARRPWSSTEVSDGTIRMLALLTALYDPRFPIVAIEEPENSVHSWMVRSFVEACREAVDSDGKQVLITSHSPALINFFHPQEILVVWRDRSGRSNIRPLLSLDPDVQSLWERGEAFLFDMLDSGLVRQAFPGAS